MSTPPPTPPRQAEQFLQWFILDELAEEVLGDLEEQFHMDLAEKSPRKAKLNYWYQVFQYLRPFAIKGLSSLTQISYAMYKNYVKIAWRTLLKQRMYSFIKIGGFALGIAACLLIALFIRDELSYDKDYVAGDRIYRLLNVDTDMGNVEMWTAFSPAVKAVLENDYPEIEVAGRLINFDWYLAGNNQVRREDQEENSYEEGFVYADQELIDILEVKMVYGKRSQALVEPHTMLISRRKAEKYFPGQNPVGRTLILNEDTRQPITIGGVMENFSPHSHMQFDFLLTLSQEEFWNGEQTSWCCSNYSPYIRVREGVDPRILEEKLTGIRDNYMVPYMQEQGDATAEDVKKRHSFKLQKVADIHLYSDGIYDSMRHGDIRFVWLFGAIAIFILLLACINFINLSTAKSANRAKEVGLRKVVGSYRGSIIRQFLTESVVFSLISFILGLILTVIALPFFNLLAGKSMSLPWTEGWFIPGILLAVLLIGIIAGLYPAVYLSAFRPVEVLKGSISKGAKASGLRAGLVVFQFTTSVILIISAFVVYRQMDFILNTELGFEKEQVLIIQGIGTLGDQMGSFKQELARLPDVQSAAASNYLPVSGSKRDQNGFWKEGRNQIDKGIGAQRWYVDEDYIETMGMKLITGRNFSMDIASDSSAMIINETMAKEFGLSPEEALGQRIVNSFSPTFHVVGVIQDFHFESIKQEVNPLSLNLGTYGENMSVKINSSDMPATMKQIKGVWNTFMPHQPIRYSFLDERYAMMYEDVQRTGSIFAIFAFLAIVVACLGLFALSAFMVEQRRKEIGIRKILGASVGNLFNLLTLNFVKLIFISMLIAMPIGWYSMTYWLEDYSYKISITWDIFAIAGLLILGIALLTISIETLRAVRKNPAGSLRSE